MTKQQQQKKETLTSSSHVARKFQTQVHNDWYLLVVLRVSAYRGPPEAQIVEHPLWHTGTNRELWREGNVPVDVKLRFRLSNLSMCHKELSIWVLEHVPGAAYRGIGRPLVYISAVSSLLFSSFSSYLRS
jgi:hypothetical protein